MFLNILKYHIISNFRIKQNFFWTLLFPMILSTFFYMAFSSLDDIEKTINFPVAVVDIDNSGDQVISTLEEISVFEIKQTDADKANDMLENGDIDAIINIEDGNASLYVILNDLSQNIIKSILDQIKQTTIIINDIYSLSPDGNVNTEALNLAQSSPSYTHQSKAMSKNNDNCAIYFFALLSMTCLNCANTSLYSVVGIQGNQSSLGARQNICPAKKRTIFGANFTGDLMSQYLSIVLVLFYIKYILRYNIGDFSIWMFLLAFVGVFVSLTIGTFFGAIIKTKDTTKSGIVTAISLISSGMAGLYNDNIKVILENKLPIIKYINPGTLISDGFISLYYYDSVSRCILRIAILGIAGIILFAGTCLVLRRQKYDSI